MGKVYAWKLVCNGQTKYAYMPEDMNGSGGITDSCDNIPACSAQNTRDIQSEEVYKTLFERMKNSLSDPWKSLLKDYSAYYDV